MEVCKVCKYCNKLVYGTKMSFFQIFVFLYLNRLAKDRLDCKFEGQFWGFIIMYSSVLDNQLKQQTSVTERNTVYSLKTSVMCSLQLKIRIKILIRNVWAVPDKSWPLRWSKHWPLISLTSFQPNVVQILTEYPEKRHKTM